MSRRRLKKGERHSGYQLYMPRYWPTWLGFLILRLLVLFPYSWMLALGPHVGRLLLRVWSSRRRIAERNLEACFPELTVDERQELLKKNFESLGIGLFEVALSWWGDEKLITKLSHVEGAEHLEEAKAKGRGVILLCAHFTTLEVSGRFLRQLTEFTPIYRKSVNPVAEHEIVRWRSRKLGPLIDRSKLRELLAVLRKNRVVWILPDQNSKRSSGVFAKFFGIDASTSTGLPRLVQSTGAEVVPFRVIRRAGEDGYDVHFFPPLKKFPSGDMVTDTQRINDIIEQWAREYPEQYNWIHRRFRTRPDSEEPPFYPGSKS